MVDNSQSDEDELSVLAAISKVLITFGALWLVSYLTVRWLVIANGGGRDIYGIRLFMPDRMPEVIIFSFAIIIAGIVLYFVDARLTSTNTNSE